MLVTLILSCKMDEEPYIIVDIDCAGLLEKAMQLDHDGCEEDNSEDSDGPENEEHTASYGEADHPGKKSRIADDPIDENKPLNRSHRNRKKKRDAVAQEQGHLRRMDTIVDLIGKSDLVQLQQDASKVLFASSCGYGGKKEGRKKKRKKKMGLKTLYTIPQAVNLGIRYISWDGRLSCSLLLLSRLIGSICRTPRPILDSLRRIIAVLVGSPGDLTFDQACSHFFDAVMFEGRKASFSKAECDHLRGKFPALNLGVTHAKGTSQPINIDNKSHTEMLQRLMGSKDAQRLASFASGEFVLSFHLCNRL